MAALNLKRKNFQHSVDIRTSIKSKLSSGMLLVLINTRFVLRNTRFHNLAMNFHITVIREIVANVYFLHLYQATVSRQYIAI